MASVTQLLTYFRRESHLIFLPFASALQATIDCLRAALSALDGLAPSAGQGIRPGAQSSNAGKATTDPRPSDVPAELPSKPAASQPAAASVASEETFLLRRTHGGALPQ